MGRQRDIQLNEKSKRESEAELWEDRKSSMTHGAEKETETGALELNDLDVQEWSVIWQELQCSQQRAIQQNTPYDIISQIGGSCF